MAEDLTLEQAQQFMRDQMRELLPEVLPQAVQQHQRSQQMPSIEQQQRAEAERAVRGIVQQDLDRTSLAANNAMDMVNFYMDDPLAREYQAEVERTFNVLLENGRPTTRKNILEREMGREMLEDPAGFEKRQAKVKKAQLARAALAGDVGEGSEGRSSGGKFDRLDTLSKQPKWTDDDVKELETMLEGEVF